jgi:hypothetical protein
MESTMPRGLRTADLFLSGLALALTTGALLVWATQLEVRATRAAAGLQDLENRRVNGLAALADLERRAGEDTVLRAATARRLEELETHALTRPSAALAEASRVRPKGVWLTRLCWAGSEIKAEGRTWGPAPANEFAGRLARSPSFAQVFTVPAAENGAAQVPGQKAAPGRFLLFARVVGKL